MRSISKILATMISVACLIGAARALAQAPVPYQAVAQPFTTWPLMLQGPSGTIQIFQPQPEKLEGDKLTARAAVSLTAPGTTEPVFGAVWLTARVATDRDARIVTIVDLTVRRTRFPDSTEEQQNQFSQILQQQLPQMHVTFSLDQLMSSLDLAQKEKSAAQDLASTPPKIIFVPAPATLVLIDGQPQLQPTADQPGLSRVLNTPFIILFDQNSRRYYLKAGDFWYVANDVMGPWTNVGSIPGNVLAEGNTLTAPPPDAVAGANAPVVPQGAQPNPGQIVVSEEPAELISTDGQPAYAPLPGNSLLYVTNTQSDVFLELATQQTYVLLSGRWFTSRSLQGPWTYVPADKLPPAFAQIPADSPKGNVLVAVAGTQQAKDARLDARVPQTAAVDRNAGQSLNVAYDGQPQFEPVPQTSVSYATNTPEAVLAVNGTYYCCHQAVWYQSNAAVGPWQVCVSVPDAIYTLPPSCPLYYVRYCYVYEATPTLVYCGYLPGYTGCFVYGPTVVYGTGYHYHGWYGRQYFARPYTWGFGVRYDPSIAAWGVGAHDRWNRNWFVSSGVTHGWWGPRGYIDYHSFPHGNVRIANNNTYINRLNVYNRTDNIRRNVVVNRNAYYRNEPARNEVFHNVPIHEAPIHAPAHVENNVYAGHDGQVYRRTNEGWQQHTAQGWSQTKTIPEARPEEHIQPHAQTPQHIEREPVRERPTESVRERPTESARERPVEHQPARVEHQAEAPFRSSGGLEAEHAAREHGAERTRGR
ncbi:MAG TPA: hypothetical protein VFC46_15430 [Humisphaera sp.]|nr:hypothetical protein [Humisphaera sp.]